MENASRALIMAAGILVGVLIISIGVVLFGSFAGSSKNILDEIENNKISEFNNQFLKYYGEDRTVTAHDVITMANIAKSNNKEYGIENEDYRDEYISIDVQYNGKMHFNFEKKSENDYADFIKQNMLVYTKNEKDEISTETKLFYCKEIKISTETGKVVHVKILEIN